MQSYCLMAVVSIFFLGTCLMYLKDNDIFEDEVILKFKRLIMVLIVEIAVDLVFVLLEGKETVGWLLYILKAGELVMNPMLAFLVFEIFYDEKLRTRNRVTRVLRRGMQLTVAANVVLQVVGVFTRTVFFLDESNVYHRGDYMWLYVLILLVMISMAVLEIVMFSSRTQGMMKATLGAFTCILVAGVFLREVFPRMNYDFLCMAVSVTFLLIYYSNVTLRIDPLTQLLNRLVYETALKRIRYTTVVLVFDANKFKKINDEHGHKRGDKALKQLAYLIRKTYGEMAYCFRQGGDEFCVILKKGVFDRLVAESPDDDDAYKVKEMLKGKIDEALSEHVKVINQAKNYLKYGVARGGCIYYGEEYAGDVERMTMAQVAAKADDEMYEQKRKMKEEESAEAKVEAEAEAKVEAEAEAKAEDA